MKKVRLSVDGINCGSCSKKIKEHFQGNSLINELSVSVEDKEVFVIGDDALSNMTLKKELEELGFSVTAMKKEA